LCKIDESDKWPKSLLLYKDVIKLVLGLKTNLQGGVIKYVAAVSKARLKWLKTQVKGETENTFHFR